MGIISANFSAPRDNSTANIERILLKQLLLPNVLNFVNRQKNLHNQRFVFQYCLSCIISVWGNENFPAATHLFARGALFLSPRANARLTKRKREPHCNHHCREAPAKLFIIWGNYVFVTIFPIVSLPVICLA